MGLGQGADSEPPMHMDQTLYCFHHANIHERRPAARLARALPLCSVVAAVLTVIVGAARYRTMLLTVAAVWNLSFWLWICSAAVFGIMGSYRVDEALRAEAAAVASQPQASGGDAEDPVRHVVVFPNYNEDECMLADTLQSLRDADGSKDFVVVLAMEEREGQEAVEKAERLKGRFADSFAKLLAAYHPGNLREQHLDGSWDEEVPGKASNLKYSVAKAFHACMEDSSVTLANSVLTVADADCLFHPAYFDRISEEFRVMRASPGEQQRWTMWQAPQLPFRNYYVSPAPSRVWGYISSIYEFGGVSSLAAGGHHMVFSAYSVNMQLALDAQLWDGDVIAEDHHAYLKAFLYSAYVSALEAEDSSSSAALSGEGPARRCTGCRPALRVRAVMLPVKSTSVIDPGGVWATYVARWHQATRHCQGVAEMSYCILATWDLLCTLPWRVYNLHFVLLLIKVVCRPFFIHILPIIQSLGLGMISLLWLCNHHSLPMCPDRIWMASSDGSTLLCGLAGAWVLVWPMVVPFGLLAVANVLFLRATFLRPHSSRSLWHSSDGSVPRTCGSTTLTVVLLIAVDCLVLMSPIMVVYGLMAELLALWNVMWYGNHFTYVTAGKATDLDTSYGAVGTGAHPGLKVA